MRTILPLRLDITQGFMNCLLEISIQPWLFAGNKLKYTSIILKC